MRPDRVERVGAAGGRLADDLVRLRDLAEADLAAEWRRLFREPPPAALPPRLVRLALAHEVQSRAEGGLAPAIARSLDRLGTGRAAGRAAEGAAAPATAKLRAAPGALLVRDWGGRTHRVEVLEGDRWRWDGRTWRSLSAIARAITGTRRNGPAFFGLREAPGRESGNGPA